MLERLLAHSFIASDTLQIGCYYLSEITNAKGGFISIRTLDYFDVVVGSMREKRIGRANSDNINMVDIEKVNKNINNVVNVKDVVFLKTNIGWFVGLDSPVKDLKNKTLFTIDEITTIVNDVIDKVYPVFNHCVKQENIPNQNRDYLTGLLSRVSFYTDFRAYLQTITTLKDLPLWLFYMDFNNFKAVNDTLGHSMGDQVLRSIALEIRSIFAGYGSVYRLGGDEFVGLCFGVDEDVVIRIKQRIENITRQAPCGLFVDVAVSAERFNSLDFDENLDKMTERFLERTEDGMYINKYHNKTANSIDCSKCKFFIQNNF